MITESSSSNVTDWVLESLLCKSSKERLKSADYFNLSLNMEDAETHDDSGDICYSIYAFESTKEKSS